MGGHAGRSLFAVVTSSALLLASLGVTAAADAGCRETGSVAPPPPYSEPYVLVRFDWAEKDDVMVTYYAEGSTDPVNDPWFNAYWTAGCTADAWGFCPLPHPLVLTADRIGGANWEESPGVYTLMAETYGACVYATDTGQADTDRVVAVHERISDFEVTATVEHYRAGESEPYRVEEPLKVMLSLHPDPYEVPDPIAYRRILGTFAWDPAIGITNLQTADRPASGADYAQTPELPPLDPRIGITDVGAPPGSDDHDDSSAQPAPRTGSEPHPLLQLMAMLMLLEVQEHGEDVAADGAMTMLRFLRQIGFLDDGSGSTNIATPETAADPDDADAVDQAAPPSVSPPKMGKEARKQQRQWVWLPYEASVRKKGATHWLKAGVWYQTKVDEDGNRAFYDKKGDLVGKSRRRVQVRVWGEEAEATDTDATNPDAARQLLTLLVDASTGSVMMKPATPPPATTPEWVGRDWVYVTLPTQVYHRQPRAFQSWNPDLKKSHVLMPGRWYRGSYRASKLNWRIYSTDGQFLGEEPDSDNVKVWPSKPQPGADTP